MKIHAILLSTVAIAALPATAGAQSTAAQSATPAAAPAADNAAAEIVVTGHAGNGIKKLEAGYSITTISATDIAIQNPKSTGYLLKSIPGVWVESSGGVGTSNVFVRGIPSTGDAPFVTLQFDGAAGFRRRTAHRSWTRPRWCASMKRCRASKRVNGGPASLYSDGQPGLTTNLLLREGHEVDRRQTSRFRPPITAQRRVDGYVSGKLTDRHLLHGRRLFRSRATPCARPASTPNWAARSPST